MSLLFTDSFDGAVAAADKWDTWGGAAIHTDYGRNGTKGALFAINPDTATVTFEAATNRVIVGSWLYSQNQNNNPADRFALMTASGQFASVRFGGTSNQFEISGTGITTQSIGPPGSARRFTWLFVELLWEPGVAVQVRINGVEVFSDVSGGSGRPSLFRMHVDNSGSDNRMDDLYIVDGAGTVNNDFKGPVKILNLKPDGNGNRSELVGSDGDSVDNYQLVNDGSDATFVEGDAADGDLYSFDDLPNTDEVLGVVQFWRAFDSEGGAVTARAIARVDGTEFDGDDETMPGSAVTHVQPWDVNPDTSAAWTPAEVDGAEFGVEFA